MEILIMTENLNYIKAKSALSADWRREMLIEHNILIIICEESYFFISLIDLTLSLKDET